MIIAGTGHRPPKLGGYCNRLDVTNFAMVFIGQRKADIDCVISGGALGWDQAIARAAKLQDIPYKMYLPFKNFESKWPDESIDYLYDLCHWAEEVKYICGPGYDPSKMQIRNEAMVTDCNVVVALYNGSTGGTRNCIYYANSVRGGKPVINLWAAWEQWQKGEEVIWPNLR